MPVDEQRFFLTSEDRQGASGMGQQRGNCKEGGGRENSVGMTQARKEAPHLSLLYPEAVLCPIVGQTPLLPSPHSLLSYLQWTVVGLPIGYRSITPFKEL